eukprot:371271-Pelagomonas_calceolata.AAC.2
MPAGIAYGQKPNERMQPISEVVVVSKGFHLRSFSQSTSMTSVTFLKVLKELAMLHKLKAYAHWKFETVTTQKPEVVCFNSRTDDTWNILR